jgi:hypothetical protein
MVKIGLSFVNMTVYRHSLIALDPRHFGRGRRYLLGASAQPVTSDEARLFALTFACGFLFTTLFIA